MQRVLRGLCHLQLHDLPAQLPGKSVSQPGDDAGGAGAAETPAPSLLLPALANGRVSFLYNTFTIRTCIHAIHVGSAVPCGSRHTVQLYKCLV